MERILGMLENLKAEEKRTGTTLPTATTKPPPKQLPEEKDKRDRALQLGRMPARGVVTGIDELLRLLDSQGLSDQEREEGIEAWAALFWFYGLTDPRLGVLMWAVGVGAPRLADAAINRSRKKKGLPVVRRDDRGRRLYEAAPVKAPLPMHNGVPVAPVADESEVKGPIPETAAL